MQSELQASVEQCKHNTDQRLRQVEEKKQLLERQLAELKSSVSDKDKRSAALQNKCTALTAILKEKQDELDAAKENLAYAYKRQVLKKNTPISYPAWNNCSYPSNIKTTFP